MLCFYITVMSMLCYVTSYVMLYNMLSLCYICYITRNVMLR